MRVAEHSVRRGHEPLVIAPEPASGSSRPDAELCYPVARMPSVALPIYPEFRVGLPGPQIRAAIAAHGADLVHLAGPVMFGASGGTAARKLGLPVVAVYATDMAAYARTYHLGRLGEKVSWALCRRIHNAVDRTLSPSTATAIDLEARGLERVSVWGRGVDTARFDPAKRSDKLRAPAGTGRRSWIVGYVGRGSGGKAPRPACRRRGPARRAPGDHRAATDRGAGQADAADPAQFLGQSQGEELSMLYASLDVFVHRSGPRHFVDLRQYGFSGGRGQRPSRGRSGGRRTTRPCGGWRDWVPGHTR